MEKQNSNNENRLRDAGASELFVEYVREAPETASARREIESGHFDIQDLADSPQMGGHFFEALWNGNEVSAIRRADSANAKIMKSVTGKTREDTF